MLRTQVASLRAALGPWLDQKPVFTGTVHAKQVVVDTPPKSVLSMLGLGSIGSQVHHLMQSHATNVPASGASGASSDAVARENRLKPPFTVIVKYDLNQPGIKWKIPYGDDPELAGMGTTLCAIAVVQVPEEDVERLAIGQSMMRIFSIVDFEKDRHITLRIKHATGAFSLLAPAAAAAPAAALSAEERGPDQRFARLSRLTPPDALAALSVERLDRLTMSRDQVPRHG